MDYYGPGKHRNIMELSLLPMPFPVIFGVTPQVELVI